MKTLATCSRSILKEFFHKSITVGDLPICSCHSATFAMQKWARNAILHLFETSSFVFIIGNDPDHRNNASI